MGMNCVRCRRRSRKPLPPSTVRHLAQPGRLVLLLWKQQHLQRSDQPLCRLATMEKQPRLSKQALKVLGALMTSPRDELSGAEIGRATKLPSGTLYPILSRLEQAHWLESRWETDDPHTLGRPRRRFYHLTRLGAKSARAAFGELEPAIGRLAWSS